MNIKEIEKYKIRDYYMIPVEVVDNMFYLFEQQYRKQKEVIDKIYKKCQTKENKQMCVKLNDEWHALVSKEEILDILKEVSE